MNLCIHKCTQSHIIYMCAPYMGVYIYVYTYVYTHIHTYTYTHGMAGLCCTYTQIHPHTHTHTHTHTHAHTEEEIGPKGMQGVELLFSRYCRRSVFDEKIKDAGVWMKRVLNESVMGLSSVKQMAMDFNITAQVCVCVCVCVCL
jgi:hypothetical protein